MTDATRTIDPVTALDHSMPAAKRIGLGTKFLELQTNFNQLITDINAAAVAGLTIPTTLQVTTIDQL